MTVQDAVETDRFQYFGSFMCHPELPVKDAAGKEGVRSHLEVSTRFQGVTPTDKENRTPNSMSLLRTPVSTDATPEQFSIKGNHSQKGTRNRVPEIREDVRYLTPSQLFRHTPTRSGSEVGAKEQNFWPSILRVLRNIATMLGRIC